MKTAGANDKEATDLGLALVNADYREFGILIKYD